MTSLVTFGETMSPGWRAGRFHELLARKLEDCMRRKIKRLIVNVPPQHGKSTESSVIFPAWLLTKFPALRIFQAGHTSDLSCKFSRDARSLVTSDAYKQLFPTLADGRVNREDYWETSLGGYYFATHVGGGTGMPADVLLIDDPHKDRAEANSQTKRDKVWDWFTSTAMTRLSPDAIVIVIQTRWHRDDLAGRLQDPKRIRALKEAGFDDVNFEVLSLEAICENPQKDALGRKYGEALWPEVRNERWLLAQKLQINSSEWNALYQQRPNPPGGNYCDITKVKIIKRHEVPTGVPLLRGWDLAISEDNAADYSCGARGGTRKVMREIGDGSDKEKIELNQMFIAHMDRNKRAWPEQKRTIINYALQIDKDPRIGVEAVSGWEVAKQELDQVLKGRVSVEGVYPEKDKLTRALPWINCIDAGNFFIVEGDWNQDFLDELEQFPNGTHDDQIDAVTDVWELSNADNFVFA